MKIVSTCSESLILIIKLALSKIDPEIEDKNLADSSDD